MQSSVYYRKDIQDWEKRWFAQNNSAYGLMQQAAWSLYTQISLIFLEQQQKIGRVAVCCGPGNNAGDGYLVAAYLKQAGFDIDVYAAELGSSENLKTAYQYAEAEGVNIIAGFDFEQNYDCYIDALFGIGLDRALDGYWQGIIYSINDQSALKISIDIPSGLHADTGRALPCAVKADYCFTLLGFKAGLFTGQAKEYTGQLKLLDLIPRDSKLKEMAQLSSLKINLVKRQAFGHKGDYGHVLVVGGHAQMGGAVMMSAEAASSAGAAKVTVVCHGKHHTAILSRAPNLMLRNIDEMKQSDIRELLEQVDAVSFGMGLGRDVWAEQHYLKWFTELNQSNLEVVYDADALWFLAKYPAHLNLNSYATPHPGEAAKLLGKTVDEIESNRVLTIQQLQNRYAGQWVLKGSGSLILQEQLWICTAGNPGMATGGMGDILAGMIASLKAQLHEHIELHQIVTLHALSGDSLAQSGMRGIQAQHMIQAIYKQVNLQ